MLRIKTKFTKLDGNIGTGTQYRMTGAQQGAVNLQFETYKEVTDNMDLDRQAAESAIQERGKVIQPQQMALQALQTNQFVNQQQWANMGNQNWNNNNNRNTWGSLLKESPTSTCSRIP